MRGLSPPLRGGSHHLKSLLLSPYPAFPPYVVRTLHPGMTDDREHIVSQREARRREQREKESDHDQPQAAGSGQEQPEPARSGQERPGAARRRQDEPRGARRSLIGGEGTRAPK